MKKKSKKKSNPFSTVPLTNDGSSHLAGSASRVDSASLRPSI